LLRSTVDALQTVEHNCVRHNPDLADLCCGRWRPLTSDIAIAAPASPTKVLQLRLFGEFVCRSNYVVRFAAVQCHVTVMEHRFIKGLTDSVQLSRHNER
jgi:hypothetical protein